MGRRVPLLRGMHQFFAALTYLFIGLFLGRHEAVLVYSPPLPLGVAGYLLARLWRGRVVINVQDLYPQTAINLGLLGSRVLIALSEKMERFLYRRADAITVHSEGNRTYVVGRGSSPDSVHVVNNWIDLSEIRPGPLENEWRRKCGLEGTFIISFAGTIGFAQGQALIEILAVADRLGDYQKVVFVIAGDGVLLPELQRRVSQQCMPNVRFLPTQPREAYLELLRASDVCLVAVHKSLETPVVPGKLQAIMAAGRPVVCYANPASDARPIIEEAGCGFFVPPDDTDGLVKALLNLYNDRELADEMGNNARRYAERNFGRDASIDAYDLLLQQVGVKEGSGV